MGRLRCSDCSSRQQAPHLLHSLQITGITHQYTAPEPDSLSSALPGNQPDLSQIGLRQVGDKGGGDASRLFTGSSVNHTSRMHDEGDKSAKVSLLDGPSMSRVDIDNEDDGEDHQHGRQ